ncbi:MAG: CAP domain-containing protein [Xanthobacteraceae bacterium]
MTLLQLILRRSAWLAALAAMPLLAACAGERDLPSEPSFYRSLAKADAKVDAGAAASMISGYRKNNGLPAVTVDPELMKLAEAQAQGMAGHDKLSHDIIRSFHDRLKAGGYHAYTAAENVGAGYHTLAEAFSGWRDSPPHRANMLLDRATRMGIAAAYSPKSKYKVFWALILAVPDDRRLASSQ